MLGGSMSLLSDLLSIFSNISVVIASFVAVSGVVFWRRKYEQQKTIDLSEEVLVLLYEYIDLLHSVRNPMFNYRADVYELQDGETESERNKRVQVGEMERRMNFVRPIVNKLSVLSYRCKVAFGDRSVAEIDRVVSLFHDIDNSIYSYYFDFGDVCFEADYTVNESLRKEAKEIRKVFIGRKNDEFGKNIEDVSVQVISYFGKYVRRKYLE
jgi:hypothetical protein